MKEKRNVGRPLYTKNNSLLWESLVSKKENKVEI